LILATGNQVLQGEVDMPQLNMAMSPDMVSEGAATGMEASMQILRATMGSVNPYALLGGEGEAEASGVLGVSGLGEGSPFVGPGLARLPGGAAGVEPEE
jgi:hypothetical protein